MIRDATLADLPAIIGMVARLHEAARMPLPLERAAVEATVRALLVNPDGLVLVLDRGAGPVGMLIASVGATTVSAARVAVEHAWWVEPSARGGGAALLARYEAWAWRRGCRMARMSTPPGSAVGTILARKGYAPAEQAWAKVL